MVAVATIAVLAGCDVLPKGDGIGTPLGEDITVAGQPGGRIDLMVQGTRPAGAPLAAVRSAAPRGVTPVQIVVTGADGAAQGTIRLTDARVSLKEFKFKRPDNDLDETEDEAENDSVKIAGPFVVDLLTDTVTPEIPSVDLVAGDQDDAGNPLVESADPMLGYGIYLRGRLYGGSGRNLSHRCSVHRGL